MVTGSMPVSSARRAVVLLYERNLTPSMSATAPTGLAKYNPCGGHGTAYSSVRPCSSSSASMVGLAAAYSASESSKLVARNGIESKPNTAFSFWWPDSSRSPIGA